VSEVDNLADVPDTLSLPRHRDLVGVGSAGVWVRRCLLGLIAAVCVLGLLDVFGQRPQTERASVPAATISVYAPTAVRGGDFMEARVHITAKHDLHKAVLVLDPGWAEGMSMNTVEPSPIGQASENGRLAFDLGHIAAGHSFILFMQFQVNPTNIAWHRAQDVELRDGPRVLARIRRSITVYP
jgi:hypothetical protein